jgi:hypothetical protein
MRQETHKQFSGIVKSNAKLYEFLWNQLEAIAARPENGYERLDYLGEPAPKKEKAKRGRKPKKEPVVSHAAGLQIEFDHRMSIGGSSPSSSNRRNAVATPSKRPPPATDKDHPMTTSTPKRNGEPSFKKMKSSYENGDASDS